MTSRDFCFWLQGYLELRAAGKETGGLDAAQLECVSRHLSLVFKHEIDPSAGSAAHQTELNKVHDPLAHAKEPRPDGVVVRC